MYLDYFKIKGTKIKIYFGELPDHILGVCDKENKKITISNKCPPDKVIEVLAHEWGHYAIHSVYLDQSLEYSQEEVICELFSYFVSDFMDYFVELKKMQDKKMQ